MVTSKHQSSFFNSEPKQSHKVHGDAHSNMADYNISQPHGYGSKLLLLLQHTGPNEKPSPSIASLPYFPIQTSFELGVYPKYK